jgi:CheY-like chemotaxis protein
LSRFWSELGEVGQPELDEWADHRFEPCLARQRERLLVARSHLCRLNPLLQAIVARDESLLDTNTDVPRHVPRTLRQPTRVLIADDERLFVDALELILAADARIEVVGRALDGRQAIAAARELDPDVVLIDLSMPGVDGFDAIAAILAENATCRIVVLSGSADPADVEKALAAGASRYLMKDRIADELVPGVLAVATV